MANFQLQAVRNGFRKPTEGNAIEVAMAIHGYEDEGEKMAITSGSEVLWTQFMSDCRSVATYTPSTGVRSLTHLQGGLGSKAFYRKLATILTEDSHIIYVRGGYDNDETEFTTSVLDYFWTDVNEKLPEAGMAKLPPWSNFEAYWSDKGLQGGTGFVFKPDGRYGILNAKDGEP